MFPAVVDIVTAPEVVPVSAAAVVVMFLPLALVMSPVTLLKSTNPPLVVIPVVVPTVPIASALASL